MVYRLAIVMPPPPILDDRKWISIAFLAISDQCATFFFSQNGCRRPFWMTENHFWSHFSPFQINTQLSLFILFTKWLPAANLDYRKSFSIVLLAISDQYGTFIFFTKWLPAGIFYDQKSLLIAFLAISDQYATFLFSQNISQRTFWMTENHVWSHFSPFQINTQLWFFGLLSHFSPFQINTQFWYTFFLNFHKMASAFLAISDQYATFLFSQNISQRTFWMTENHVWSHFSPFQINTQLRFFGLRSHFSPFQINTQFRYTFFFNFHKMAAGGH